MEAEQAAKAKQDQEDAVEKARLDAEKKKKDAAKKRLKVQRKQLLDLIEVILRDRTPFRRADLL